MAASDVTLDGTAATSRHAESTGHSPHAATPADAGQADSSGGLQSEINANQTIIANKPGPECPDNILHNYANYTYKISLMTWDSIEDYNADIQNGKWPLKENNKKVLFSSGGIAEHGPGASGPPGRNYPTPAPRHEEFDVDFYISSFTTTSIMGLSGESRATNIFECNMEVVEPIGATLLERFYTLVTRDGRENWAEFPLLIKIEFIGYDESGKPELIKPAMRQIPVRLINMVFDVAGDGSTCGLQFVASTTIKKDHPRNIKMESNELWGVTVGEFLTEFAQIYNDNQKHRTHIGPNMDEARALVSQGASANAGGAGTNTAAFDDMGSGSAAIAGPKVQEVADTIEFDIDPAIAKAKIVLEVAEDAQLEEKPKEDPFKDMPPIWVGHGVGVKAVKARAAIRKKVKDREAKAEAEKSKGIIPVKEGNPAKVSIAAGTKQLAVIEKIITFSEYITDQLIDPENAFEGGTNKSNLKNKELLKNPDQGLLWWKVTFVPVLKEWDDARGQYGMHTIIQITPYRVNDPVTTGGKCEIGVGVTAPAMRNYQYIYTGQNIDVKDFAISFNNSFMQSMIGQGTGDSKKAKVDESKNSGTGPGLAKSNATTPASADQHDRRYSTGSNHNSKQKAAGTILENLYRKLGSDMMQCTINIVGDPLYIQQDGIVNVGRKTKTGTIDHNWAIDPANGAALADHQDAHIYLSYKTPTDYSEGTGLMDFNAGDARHRSSTLSGYYRVWEVVNTFQGGEFNQSLNLTRVYNQWREQKYNPLEEGSFNDRSDFTQGGASLGAGASLGQIANSIATSGGSAKRDTTSEASLTTRQRNQLAIQQDTLKKEIDLERTILMNEATDPGVLSVRDSRTTSSNVFVSNDNARNKQNTDENKIRFDAAQKKLTNINALSDTSSVEQQTTFADNVNAMGNNTDTLSQTFDNDSLTPTFSENSGHPSQTSVAGLRSSALHKTLTGVANGTSIVSTTNNGAPLFDYNKKGGLYGVAENEINLSSYTADDKASINTNEELIRTQREILIGTGNLVAKKAAYTIANDASKTNQTIHGKYGNIYRTWEEVGYFQNLLIS